MASVKLYCKECYIENYGALPNVCGVPLYELSNEKMICDICGKKKYIVLSKEKSKGTILKFE